MSWLLASGSQSIGASASTSVLPMNIQDQFFRIDCFGLLAVQRRLNSSSPAPQFKGINSSVLSLFYCSSLTLIHDYWKNHSFHYMDPDVGNLSLVLLPLLNTAYATEGLGSHTVEA